MNPIGNGTFFNVKYTRHDLASTINCICASIKGRGAVLHRGDINVSTVVMASENKEFADAINSADVVNFDGAGARIGAFLLGINPPERITGVDLFIQLLSVAEREGFGVYFLGATDEVLSRMISIVREKHPMLNIVGSHNGFFWKRERELVQEITSLKPDMLFIGIKSPEKEFFIRKNKHLLSARFVMGVGGTFDVVSGKVRRAPVWMQRMALEWLYRVMQEPRRMWKRYLVTNTKFSMLLIGALFKKWTD